MNGPNRPCECGSGRKQKKCHPFGAPLEGPELPARKRPPVVRDSCSDFLLLMAVSSLSFRRGIR